jgi:hypothetical protein
MYDPKSPWAAVIVYSDGNEDPTDPALPAFCSLAHNLYPYDARKLADRLTHQYELSAHVVMHQYFHDEKESSSCKACELLFSDVIERASKVAQARMDVKAIIQSSLLP